jgi:hypothetical protein
MKKLVLLIAVGMVMTFGTFAFAAPAVDVVETPTNYFVPTDGQKYDVPYYRWWNQDWGWQHNAVAGSFTSATLRISAWDVDYSSGERDKIFVGADYASRVEVSTTNPYLIGADDDWAYTDFDVTAYLSIITTTGLYVWMDIDSTHTSDTWAVALAKSTLSLDGGAGPGPEPGPVPEPLTMLLLGLGLTGIAGARRFTK